MTLRKSIAWVLTAMLAMTAFIGSTGQALAEDTGYAERAYISKLSTESGELSCSPKDTVTLNLSVSAADAAQARPYGIRAYDNTITIDTTRFEVVSAEAAAGLPGQNAVNTEYEINAARNLQKIKWIHMSQNAAADLTSELVLGKIVLKVKEGAPAGAAPILQSVEGISDHTGAMARPSKVIAEALTLNIDDGRAFYRFGLETEKTALTAGETFTVKAYLTSSAVTFAGEMASNRILFDRERFELVSSQAKPGVQMNTNGGTGTDQIATLVYSGGGSVLGNRLELAELTLKVKEGVQTGLTTIRQDQAAVKEVEGPSSHVSAQELKLAVIVEGDYRLKLAVRDQKTTYYEGDTLLVDLSMSMEREVAPRAVQSELLYPNAAFEVVSTSAISDKSSISAEGGVIKFVYFDGDSSAAGVTDMQLGSIKLKVRAGAPTGEASISPQEANLYDQTGTLYAVQTKSTSVQLKKAGEGVTVSGNVALTAGNVSSASVILTKTTIGGAEEAYKYTAGTGDYTASVSSSGAFTLEGVAADEYTLLIRKPGALYYQKNKFKVEAENVVLPETVTLSVGDVDKDGYIALSDISVLMDPVNYGNQIGGAGVLEIGDLDEDGYIALSDISVIMDERNYGKEAIAE